MRQANGFYWLLPFFVCLLFIFVLGCASEKKFAGTYRAQEGESPAGAETFLELKETGEGAWRVDDDEVPFSWYVKGNELRFNTKNGGVIVGKIHGDAIEIALPGNRTMVFKKSR